MIHQRDRQHPKLYEKIARIERVANWISQGFTLRQIFVRARNTWGPLSCRTIRRYAQRARMWMLRPLDNPLEHTRAAALRFYDNVLSDPGTSTKEKLLAWREKLKVVGALQQKITVEHQGGYTIAGNITVETVRELVVSMREDRRLRDEIYSVNGLQKLIAGAAPTNGNGGSAHLAGTNGKSSHNGKVPGP